MARSAQISRRDWLRLSAAGVVGYSMSGWLESMAADIATDPQRRRSCILLWMNGGPSQMDTFDLKPGHANGGPFKEIQTSIPGIQISEHLPRIAKNMEQVALIRSMSTKEADHGRATYLMRTGHVPGRPGAVPARSARCCPRSWANRMPRCRTSSASPRSAALSPAAYGPVSSARSMPRWSSAKMAIASAGRSRPIPIKPCRSKILTSPQRRESHAGRTPGCELLDEMEQDFLAQRATVASFSHQHGLPAGRDVDAFVRVPRRSTWTRSPTTCATATAATCSARAVCWPGGWWSAACRSSR